MSKEAADAVLAAALAWRNNMCDRTERALYEAVDHYEDVVYAEQCRDCARPIDGYIPTPRDAKLAPADGLCEECHADHVRAAKRERADLIADGRGDYLRDMQKGA